MHRSLANLGLVLCLVVLCGCQAIPLFSRYTEADSRHPVMEVLCVWEPAEGRGVDNSPCRGFGGQVLCFASGYKEPVKVRGDVRVYVFDDKGVNGDTSLPIHQFDFTADAWNTFLKPSSLGPSYQIFIPYTRKGLDEASCTLRVRLTPEGGLPVYSRMATVALAGSAGDKKKSAASAPLMTVSHEEKADSGQGITTADFAEIVNAPKATVESFPPSKTPAISMALHQDEVRQTERIMSSLRQASEEASRPARTEPSQMLTKSSSIVLKSLDRSATVLGEDKQADPRNDSAAASGETRGLTGKSPSKRPHPLEDFDAE